MGIQFSPCEKARKDSSKWMGSGTKKNLLEYLQKSGREKVEKQKKEAF